jgi:two-component system, NarL family, invasion response regulator UvrY
MIRVLLVDDHAVVRVGFKLLLQTAPDIEVIGEAESGEAACAKMADHSPDVIVMDISMPGIGGLEALRRIKQQSPVVRILALSAHDDVMHAQRAMRQGAVGFLSKRSAPEVLLQAVRTVAAGKRFIDSKLAQDLALSGIEIEGDSTFRARVRGVSSLGKRSDGRKDREGS